MPVVRADELLATHFCSPVQRSLSHYPAKAQVFYSLPKVPYRNLYSACRISSLISMIDIPQPILSICIPTYNRASCLDRLLYCLSLLNESCSASVEICISDNQSTDHTQQLISSWSQKISIKSVVQSANLGASKNVQEVVKLASGRWILIVGDDDSLNLPGFERFMKVLECLNENLWILLPVGDKEGRDLYLSGMSPSLGPGIYESVEFGNILMRIGLYRFGFIGMHAFPASCRQQLVSFSTNESRPWPHLALFMRYLKAYRVFIFSDVVVSQAFNGNELYWSPSDWASINLAKIHILEGALRSTGGKSSFFRFLMLREFHSWVFFKTLILSRTLEPHRYRSFVRSDLFTSYHLLGILTPLLLFHFLGVLLLYLIPSRLLECIFSLAGKSFILDGYRARAHSLARFNGFNRGV